jgi:hypothetical protein
VSSSLGKRSPVSFRTDYIRLLRRHLWLPCESISPASLSVRLCACFACVYRVFSVTLVPFPTWRARLFAAWYSATHCLFSCAGPFASFLKLVNSRCLCSRNKSSGSVLIHWPISFSKFLCWTTVQPSLIFRCTVAFLYNHCWWVICSSLVISPRTHLSPPLNNFRDLISSFLRLYLCSNEDGKRIFFETCWAWRAVVNFLSFFSSASLFLLTFVHCGKRKT